MGDRERAAQANRTTLGFHIGRCVGISMGLLLFVGAHDCANEFMLESKSNAVGAFHLCFLAFSKNMCSFWPDCIIKRVKIFRFN